MTTPLNSASIFLIQIIFGLYIFALMVRAILLWFRADSFNPIAVFIFKITNPPIYLLRKVFPIVARVDLAAIFLMLLLEVIQLLLIAWISAGIEANIIGLVIWGFADLLTLLINIFFYAILIMVILSWIKPGGYNPTVTLLYSITEPLLHPVRKWIPQIAGIDITPIPVMIILKLLIILVVSPIESAGIGMAMTTTMG